MAGKLDQFLQPAERVLYREPDGPSGWSGAFGQAFVMSALGPIMGSSGGVLRNFLAMLLLLVAGWTMARSHNAGMVEAAVTGRRVLRIKGEGRALEFTEIMVEEVALIEVLGSAVRVKKRNGGVVVLDRLAGAPDLGLALAQAAGLPPPWVPGRKELLAEEVVVLSGFVVGALAFALTLGAPEDGSSASSPFLSRIAAFALGFAAGGIGWFVGTLLGLALLRPHLTRAEMRAWMRQSALFAPKPQPSARTGRFARFCLWFVDQLYDPAADPPAAPDERHGQ